MCHGCPFSAFLGTLQLPSGFFSLTYSPFFQTNFFIADEYAQMLSIQTQSKSFHQLHKYCSVSFLLIKDNLLRWIYIHWLQLLTLRSFSTSSLASFLDNSTKTHWLFDLSLSCLLSMFLTALLGFLSKFTLCFSHSLLNFLKVWFLNLPLISCLLGWWVLSCSMLHVYYLYRHSTNLWSPEQVSPLFQNSVSNSPQNISFYIP